MEITELPIGTWTEDYKEFLESLITSNTGYLKSFESHYTAKNIKFILHFFPGARAKFGDKFETEYKLYSSKNMGINNMHLYNESGTINKYTNTTDIIKEWSKIRILKYHERKVAQLKILEKEFTILSAKIRFILDVISGNIKIMNIKLNVIADKLHELKYPKITKDDEFEDVDDNTIKGYNYLLKMPISQLTLDRKIILENEVLELENKIKELNSTSIQNIWKKELDELINAWEIHKTFIENDYLVDKNNISNNKTKTKTKK